MIARLTRAVAVAASVSASVCALSLISPQQATAAEKISKSVAPALAAAQKAAQAGNWQEALNQAKGAQSVGDRTPFDDVEINYFIGLAAINLKDMATATTAFEAAADSPANTGLDAPDRTQLYHNALILAGNAQQWQKVIAYGQALEQQNSLDDVAAVDVAVAYYNLKDPARAQQYAQKSVDLAKAAGKPPNENAQRILMNAQAQANPAAAEQMLENVVLQSGSPDDWSRLIDYNFGASGMNDILAMDLYRLKYLTHSMKKEDASLAGKLANQLYYPGDAVTILESAGLSGPDLTKARAAAAKEKGALSAEIAAAKRGTAQDAIKVGEALYGYGQYAQAEELARAAIAKGPGKGKCASRCDPAEAPLLLGMSLVGQGKYGEAVTAFNGVTGSAAATKTARLWSIYAQSKQRGAGH